MTYYEDKYVKIYHGDCREILPQISPADIILTSPPYNVGLKYVGYDDNLPDEKFRNFNREWVEAVKLNDNARMYIVLGDKMIWWFKPLAEMVGWPFVQMLVWCKPNLAGAGKISNDWNYMTEWVLYFRYGKRTPMLSGLSNTHNYFEIAAPQRNFNCDRKMHVAQFPIELPKRWISRTPGDLIVDPFMGAGTTLVAAKTLNRQAIGIDIEERNCEIAAKRLAQEVLDLGEKVL